VSDYGHDLEFGVFITPSVQAADAVVALAVLADEVGLDLVTFQDHPYQPSFLDTWTVLSFVAARPSRVPRDSTYASFPDMPWGLAPRVGRKRRGGHATMRPGDPAVYLGSLWAR